MGFLDTASDELQEYKPTQFTPANSNYQDMVDQGANKSLRQTQSFTNDINQNVKDQSNLLGNSQQEDPQSAALSARARQIQDSSVHQMMRQSELDAVNRQGKLQGQSLENQAASYANAQSRAQLNYQQIAAQRESAIAQESLRRSLFGELFGGLFKIGGMMAAKGMELHGRRKDSIEPNGASSGGPSAFNFDSGSATPSSFNSEHFGTIGGK